MFQKLGALLGLEVRKLANALFRFPNQPPRLSSTHMESVLSVEASRPRMRFSISTLAASAALRALVPLLLLLPFPLFAQTSSPSPHRCLLVVETSHSMQRRAQGVSKTVKEFLDSGLHGQLRDGDSVALWTYSDTLITNRFLPWTSQTKIGLALRVADLLQPATYEKKASLDKVLPEITRIVGGSDLITVLLLCSGEDKVQGTSVDQQLNDGCQQWQSEVLEARMPMVILLRARHGQLTDWSVSPATWPIELPPLPQTQATVSTASQTPAVAATRSNPVHTDPAPGQVTNGAPSTTPVSVQPASSIAPATVLTTGSDKAPPQTNATASPVVAPTHNPVPQTTEASSPSAPPNPGPSAPTQAQAVASTTTTVPSAKPVSGTTSQTSLSPPPVEVPKSKGTNPSPQPLPAPPALAQAAPVPNSSLSAASIPPASNSPVADTLPATATSIPNTSVTGSQPPPSPPTQTKPAALPISSTAPRNTFLETALWIALIVVSVLGAIYFIWSWLATHFRPRTQERIILQPRSTSHQIGQPASASTAKPTATTPQIIDGHRPAPTTNLSPQKTETVQ